MGGWFFAAFERVLDCEFDVQRSVLISHKRKQRVQLRDWVSRRCGVVTTVNCDEVFRTSQVAIMPNGITMRRGRDRLRC